MSKRNDDTDLTRQDEEVETAQFEAEESRDRYDFGNWPELVGLIFAAAVIWYSFSYTG